MSRSALAPILDHVRAEPSRTWSIIITVYGDAIVPRGGSVWLGTLLAFFKALEIGEGVVRTAMSRLAADGWLERSRVGRNSFYRLADKGSDTFRRAAEHIYNPHPPAWAGHFEMVLLDGAAGRAALREAGFGTPAPGVWIAPGGTPIPPEAGDGLRLVASADDAATRALVARSWPLDETAAAYRRFLDIFGTLATETPFSDIDALVARILLIHEYRRIVLRDPILPPAILPADWPGEAARALCAEAYRHLLPGSERWLDAHAVGENGEPLTPDPAVWRRLMLQKNLEA